MKIDILSLFPQMFAPLSESIIGRAVKSNLLEINTINFRDFSSDKHKKVDDTPFGGGAGMILSCQPLFDAIESVKTEKSKIIYMSPRGKTLSQKIVKELAKNEHLIVICGHYEGIDQRVLDYYNAEEISIGDYVLTGGELPAMVLIDSVARYVPNVLSEGSTDTESFSNNMLEYPQYTKPQVYKDMCVPEVLYSGNHQKIKQWQDEQSLLITKKNRPDLLDKK